LKRLHSRPQFICQEGAGPTDTRLYLATEAPNGNFTFTSTGFSNHNDAWALRPSNARVQLREWLAKTVK
jgi:hypothetical protein